MLCLALKSVERTDDNARMITPMLTSPFGSRSLHQESCEAATDISPAERSPVGIPIKVTTQLLLAHERAAFAQAAIGMSLLGLDGLWVAVNAALCELLGRDETQLVGHSYQEVTHPDDLALGGMPTSPDPSVTGDRRRLQKRYVHSSGRILTVDLHTIVLRNEHGAPLGYFTQTIDITEQQTLQEQLAVGALRDPVTGLANRVLFAEQVRRARERKNSQGLAVAQLVINNLGDVRDALGPHAADAILRQVATRCATLVAASVVVARLEGDHFGMLFEDDGLTDAAREVHRILDVIDRTSWGTATEAVRLHASAGLAEADGSRNSAEELVRDAEIALHEGGGVGGAVCLYQPAMHAARVERIGLEGDLRQALAAGELFLEYQPIVSLQDTATTVGAEALLRWNHPRLGLLGPARFIPIAEASGLIVPIGRWIIAEAMAAASSWSHPHSISINLSAAQLLDADLIPTIEQALSQTNLMPDSVVIELTESVSVEASALNLSVLRTLKQLGVRLALDDFGTGYSSLSYLERFPVDILKLDQSFVNGLEHGNAQRVGLVQSVAHLAKAFDLRLIAEGVELEAQREALLDLGYCYGQGYLFGRPGTSAAIDDATLRQRG